MRQDSSSASAGGPKPHSDHICSRASPQVSLLHSACPALVPLVFLPPSLGSAAGLSPLLPQEVTASTVWHMPQFCFMPLLSSLPLLTSCLSTHSDTHSTLLLWQNWGLQRVSIISKIFRLLMRKSGHYFCHEEAEKAQAVKHW